MPAFGLNGPAAYVVIVATTAIIWTLLVLAIRIFLRLKINGPFGYDDLACFIATFLAIAYSSLCLGQIGFGLGQHVSTLSANEIGWAQFLTWMNAMLFVAGSAASIMSICLLIARINQLQRRVWIAYGICLATLLWALISIFFYAFSCRLPRPWDISDPNHCIHRWALTASVESVRTALELANVIASVVLVWSLQMLLRPKMTVVAMFAIRLLVIAPSITRLRYSHMAIFSHDWSYARIDVVIISNITLHLSIILATVPCARPFLAVFESGNFHHDYKASPGNGDGAQSAQLNRRRSTVSQSVERAKGPAGHRKRVETWRLVLRRDMASTVTTVRHDPEAARAAARRRPSYDSERSGKLSITRTDSFKVAYEDMGPMSE